MSFIKNIHYHNPFHPRRGGGTAVDFYLPMGSESVLDHPNQLCRNCEHFICGTLIGKDLFLLKNNAVYALISVNEERKIIIITAYILWGNMMILDNAYHYYTEAELKQIYTEINQFQQQLEDIYQRQK